MARKAIIFLTALVIGLGTGIANAGTAYSPYSYLIIQNERQYRHRAGIHTNHDENHRAHASSNIRKYNSTGNDPAGWQGVQPRRTTSAALVVCTGTWFYSDGPSSGIGASACSNNTHSTWGSRGRARVWNTATTAYQTFDNLQSPNQNS